MKSSQFSVILIVAATIAAIAIAIAEEKHVMAYSLSSNAFHSGGDMPKKYTCEGADVSPGLSWTNPPKGTQAFALIADDPDAPAGTWTHWVLYDLPPNTDSLDENIPKPEQLPNGARQGRNDFKKIGYGGPCPPPGKPHRYFFKLYALDQKLGLQPGASKSEVEAAMKGHIVGQAELMGKFAR